MQKYYIFESFSNISKLIGRRFISCHVVSNDTNFCMFQYKILNNILYLNKKLFIFNKKDTKLCSYFKLQDETINHIFVECKFAIKLWSDLRNYCQRSFVIPTEFILNRQSATFGFVKIDPDLVILLNHIHDSSKLLFKTFL